MRITLIVAIIAGLAVAGLNFVLVKEKVVNLAADRDKEKGLKETALTDLAKTRKDYERSESLYKTGDIADTELEAYRLAFHTSADCRPR